MKTQLRHIILLLAIITFFGGTETTVAQERADVTLVASGNQVGGNITANTTWNITGHVNLQGQIVVKTGATLTIKVKNDVTGNKYIRRRNKVDDSPFNGAMFKVEYGATLKVQKNNEDAQVELRGGASFSTTSDGRTTCTSHYGAGVIILAYGNLNLSSCKLLNVINTPVDAPEGTTATGAGGAIECVSNSNDEYQTITMTDVDIYGCKATKGSAICFWGSGSLGPDNHRATLTRVNIYHCHSTDSDKAGTIRTFGDAKTQLTLDNCDIYENKSNDRGGGVYWNAGGDDNALITIKGSTKIRNNTATNEGGGIFLTGGMDLQSATISGNGAKYGAGIYMDTYDGGVSAYNGQAFDFTMKSGVTISSNTATTMGGGVMLRIRKSADVGYGLSGGAVDVTFGFDMQGGNITGNKAPQGAGVAIEDDAPRWVKYSNVKSGEYKRDVKIRGGSIYSNITTGASNVRGGGVYIYKHVTAGNNWDSDYGNIPIAISGGGIYSNTATLASGTGSTTNGSGGGIYILNSTTSGYTSTCSVTVSGSAQIYGNSSTNAGGGIYLNGGTFTMKGGHVGQNSSGTASANRSANGAGFYIDGGSCTIQGGNIVNNVASSNGGGFYVDPGASATTIIECNPSTVTTIVARNQALNGGGVYVKTGALSISSSNTEIKTNTATNDGAGVYVAGGSCTLSGGYIHDNDATRNGGGIYMNGGNFTHSGGEIGKNYGTNGATANTAVNGAGIYMNSGTYTFGGGYINGNKASGNGGGVYMNGGTFNFNGGRIGYGDGEYRNTAVNGAGVYMGGTSGTFQMPDPSLGITVGTPSIEGNYATGDGGGIYMASGTCSITKGTIGSAAAYHNEAANGGGIYVDNGAVITVIGGSLNYNKAGTDGGGLYVAGSMFFSDGDINYNTATSGNGGGISIASTGSFSVSGTAEMTGNSVPSGQGGGVYQNGTMNADGTSLTIIGNTKGTAKTVVDNNVYLPSGKTIDVGNGINASSVQLGITTYKIADIGEDIPVLTGNNTVLSNIYTALVNETSQIKDDQNLHRPKFPGAATGTLYFTRILFDHGPYDGQTFSNPIDTQEKLYRFMCYVNGVNGFSGTQANATGNITADIDMTGVDYWLPIGDATAFNGTLNGNGHVISNLHPDNLSITSTDYGLFGTVAEGAVISEVFLTNCELTNNNSSGTLGCLAGKMTGGTVKNCGSAGSLSTTNSSCIVGGLVGNMTGGTIHSSFATTSLKGYKMGGLVGEMTSGTNLMNSFANAKFTESGSDYCGGLVGVNNGRIENCYAREQSGSSHGSKFGYLAGANVVSSINGNLNYCYAPSSAYTASGVEGNQTQLSTFGETHTPYLYKHQDNQVASVSGATYIENGTMGNAGEMKGLLATLNNWVTLNSGATAYTPWMRTCASPINGDYPLFNYAKPCCVGSKDNITLEYSSNFNTLFGNYIAGNGGSGEGTIYLYRTPSVLNESTDAQANVSVSNYGKATKLYIGEHVALKPVASGSKAAGDIEATVGITLDNSAGSGGAHPTQGGIDAMDWHMFATPLQAAPLGINYTNNTEYPFTWGHPSASGAPMPYWRFYDDAANHGYFPSMEYSWAASNDFTYNATNTGAATNGNWYNDWDYYTYYEPEYHWINFKRNGNSHWHEDYPDVKINYRANETGADYTNEQNLIKGRGYLVSTVEPTYLQCSGTLTKGNVTVPVTARAWVRKGYNLLGNPYQSHLDFNAFAAANSGDGKIWSDVSEACYYIIDEDAPYKGYAKYAYNASENEYIAQSYLHPHQGFMVITESAATATFTDAMRNTTRTDVTFRGVERPAYPLVNLIMKEENGNTDVCTVELSRPDKGGAPVMRELRVCKGVIYCHYDDRDWAIAFTEPGITEVPIRIETMEDAEFTLTWDTENGDFSYLHIIDNLTGADIDCLTKSEYRFVAKESDYASRFRLVFGYTGIDNPEVLEPVEGPAQNFAFQTGDELVVSGEGRLEVIDMLGRIVRTENLHGVQSAVRVPQGAAGVYVLRLSTKDGIRTQKIVLE